jgi:hypothetical protein
MPSPIHEFYFDTNYSFNHEGVFTLVQPSEGAPFPPSEGFFLLLDGTDFLLLDGENLALL